MSTLAELPSTIAVITIGGLIALTVVGCTACWIVNVIAKAPDRSDLAACLKEVAAVIQAVRRSRS